MTASRGFCTLFNSLSVLHRCHHPIDGYRHRNRVVRTKLRHSNVRFEGFALLFPALVFYGLMTAVSAVPPPPLAFLGGFAILALGLLFYLSLSLLLGTVFESRGALAGSVFGFMVAGFLVANYATWLTAAFPWLFFQSGYYLVKYGYVPFYGLVSIPASAIWCGVFIFLALRRFERAEL